MDHHADRPSPGSLTTVDIVVCVHDALDDVRRCLASLVRHTASDAGIVLVDDGSAPPTRDLLAAFARSHPNRSLIRNDAASGYTKAANQGLLAARADLVVLLNSDAIVTPAWLERLRDCAASDPRLGIVGPLSNAAGYQSVPQRFRPNGDWSRNPYPPGWGPDQVAAAVAALAPRAFPRVAFVNGFCFAIKRDVIDAIGCFDEDGFPEAYGEEDDYCLRAAAAGFELAIADHAYVHHAGSRSYPDARRHALKEAGTAVLLRKHGGDRIRAGVSQLYDEPTLAAIRRDLGHYLEQTSPPDLGPAPTRRPAADPTPARPLPAASSDRRPLADAAHER